MQKAVIYMEVSARLIVLLMLLPVAIGSAVLFVLGLIGRLFFEALAAYIESSRGRFIEFSNILNAEPNER